MKMRLDRWLATLSLGSRSEVREWIRGGKAAVNGRIIRDPALSFETEEDRPALNGREIDGRVMRHVMMHKPGGLLTAARDAYPQAQHLLWFPAAIVSVITITFYLVGNAFSDACDPRNHV